MANTTERKQTPATRQGARPQSAPQDRGRQQTPAAGKEKQDSGQTFGQQAQQWAGQAQDAWQSVSQFCSRYPIPVFFAGVGLGFLLARALDRWPDNMASRMSQASAR